ncbi:MAG: PEGA domain-containing protein [Planctomycetes bacterium]|nr:PEGA domain-containing protein [Planctomycetota bacterium]
MLAVVALVVCQLGCVRRRMTIRSNPPGAKVYVDDYEIGTTPISRNFTYYGTRKIRLVKDGYETLTVMQPVPPPWYQIPPLDFVSETLSPGEHHDRRTLSYQLTPQRVVPSEQLLARAEDLRTRARSSGIVLSSPSVPGGVDPTGPTSGPYLAPGPQPSGGVPVHTLPPGGWAPPRSGP